MSKFNKIFNNIMNENIYNKSKCIINEGLDNNAEIKIIIVNVNQLTSVVTNYYKEYYKDHENNRPVTRIGETYEGEPIYEKPTRTYGFLNQDLKNFKYSNNEFSAGNSNVNVDYIVALLNGYLIGLIKYWHKSSQYFPCVGFIDVNKEFKNNGIGSLLLDKVFQLHKEKHPNEPLLFTEFSDEGILYVKPVVKKLSNKYNVDIFSTDDVRRYYTDEMLKNNKNFNDKKQYEYEFEVPESIKTFVKNQLNKK